MKLLRLIGAIGAVAPSALWAQAPTPAEHPALVVLIAIDQFRGDYLDRFGAQLTGGLARFRTQSALFTHALQDHAITETAPGHSTMLSGREPAHTTIVDNNLGVYDPDSPLIGGVKGSPASPQRFVGTELFDWMRSRDSKTQVLSVSRKDRGAILPVGRSKGNVYWFGIGGFTTSKYYADALPEWVRKFNASIPYDQLAGKEWNLLLPADKYPEPDSVPAEGAGGNYLFPHVLPSGDALRSGILAYPWMDSLTLAFALDGIHATQLGKRALQSTGSNTMPDLLSISLSTTDAVGHAFGPDSRELHDHILRLDRWLGAFLDSLQREVPAERMIFVLTSDHGMSPFPEILAAKTGHGGRLWMGDVAHQVEQSLEARNGMAFGIEFESGLFYANVGAMKARRVNVDSVANALVAESMKGPGVRIGFTARTLPTSQDSGAVRWRRTLPPQLGWLAVLVADDGFIWSGRTVAAEHGTPTADALSIPIAFMGPGIAPARYDRTVRSVDIAPTLAKLLGITPSEPLDGAAIDEVLVKK
ncbi:MAG TPA: alkaline phosphatase family protein [Gemmatimonadaceae bacterium]|jgi:predicted AlkP superfamily pyrophosphatase or phosphodiesterase|nr:alkaline phosphatase family protein [Gemmatimonadaceae bacterium]